MTNLFDPNHERQTSSWLDTFLTVLIVLFLAFGIVAFGTYVKANAADVPNVTICTGGKDNPYDRSAKYIAQFTKQLTKSSICQALMITCRASGTSKFCRGGPRSTPRTTALYSRTKTT